MSENENGLEALEAQGSRDIKLGIRVRRRWAEILVEAERHGLTEKQVRGFVERKGLFAGDAERSAIAADLGFDWEGAAEFFATIAPIIIEMMAACGV